MRSVSESQDADKEYFDGRVKHRLYISKQFEDNFTKEKKRFAHKINESEHQERFFKVKNEIVIGISNGGRYQIKAILAEDSKKIESLIIQSFSASGNPHPKSYSFFGYEIENLYKFLKGIKEISYENSGKFAIDDSYLDELLLSKDQASKLVIENQDLIIDALKNNITKSDIIALGYRKNQLEKFEKLLSDHDFFENEKTINKIATDEAVWQTFLEKNTWILGYGLNYIFNTPLEGKKLEQVVSGFDVFKKGKRVDALLKTRGIVSSLVFGEIKTHKKELLKNIKDSYRGESWAISDELAGGVAQVHRTLQLSIENIKTKTEIKDGEDDLTGEQVFLYNPKSVLIIGSLEQFKKENGINEIKYSSFEMFRRNIHSPEIITFDELLERAKFIIESDILSTS
ncbi:MAG: Shedu immune nuclease family protein [Sphingobacteriales bacterium]